jgi:hypothetical protein
MKIFLFLAGLYLLAVVYQGNTQALITQAKQDTSFIYWLIGLGIFWVIFENAGEGKPIVGAFGGLAIVALLLNSTKNGTLTGQFSQIMGAIKSGSLSSL